MINFNKKAQMELMEIVLIIIFLVFLIIILIFAVLIGKPKDLSEQTKAQFDEAQETAVLNNLLRSQIIYNQKEISFAEYLRLVNINDKTAQQDIKDQLTLELSYTQNTDDQIVSKSPDLKLPSYYLTIKKENGESFSATQQDIIIQNKVTTTIPDIEGLITITFGFAGYMKTGDYYKSFEKVPVGAKIGQY